MVPVWLTRSNRQKDPSNNESGSVSVEFALMFPIFLLLLFAAYELGIFLHDKQVLTNATREAARFGITMQVPRPTEPQIQQRVLDWSTTLVGTNLASSQIVVTGEAGNSGTNLTVTVTTPFNFPLLSTFSGGFPTGIPIVAQTIMVLE